MCGVADDVVGVCGFSVESCPVQTVAEFCTANPNATSFMGGLSGARAGFYGYAVLALYVPSTSVAAAKLSSCFFVAEASFTENQQSSLSSIPA